jgi:signal peptidase I
MDLSPPAAAYRERRAALLRREHEARSQTSVTLVSKEEMEGKARPRPGSAATRGAALQVRIAEICLKVSARDSDLTIRPDEATERFVVSAGRPEAEVTAGWGDPSEAGPDALVFDSGGVWRLYRDGDRCRFVFSTPTLGSLPYKEATFERDFTSGEIMLRRSCFESERGLWPLEYPLDELIVQGLLARGRGAELHACGVRDREGRGLLFVGQSGAGKSTLASLWQRIGGATILSDDRVIVRGANGRFVIFGTPWHGEAALAEPASAELAGIFFLEHRATNTVVPIAGSEAAAALFACGFPPFFDRDGLEFTLGLFEAMATAVPCQRFGFVPDVSAVGLVQEWVHARTREKAITPTSHLDPADSAFVEVVSEVLGRGHSARFRAKGTSMHPTIREGEVVTVAPVQPTAIRRGDIILYRSGQSVFAHRVVRITRQADGANMLLLRGDAAPTYDEPVSESAVLGRVVAVERNGRPLDLGGWRSRTRAAGRTVLARMWRRLRVSLPSA